MHLRKRRGHGPDDGLLPLEDLQPPEDAASNRIAGSLKQGGRRLAHAHRQAPQAGQEVSLGLMLRNGSGLLNSFQESESQRRAPKWGDPKVKG